MIMIATLFFMDLAGISLNNLSLLALALVVGLVIDDGIVVRENIIRWIDRGYRPMEAASKGTAEVIVPVIATSATILAVFLPVAYAEGIIGQFFKDFGFTVSIAIIVSTFEALTMAPMLSAYFFKKSDNEIREHSDDLAAEVAGRGVLDRLYARVLNWTLDHKIITTVMAILVIGVSMLSARYIDQAFLPNLDRGQFDVGMELASGTPLDVTTREALQVEAIIRSHPMVEDVFTTIGGTGTPESAGFFVKVFDDGSKEPSRQVIDALREPLSSVPGISFQLSDGATGGDNLLGGKEIIVEMVGATGSYNDLGAQAELLAAELATVPGLVDLDISYKSGKPEAQLKVDRARASEFGLTTAQIGSTLRTLVNGEVASTFRGEGTEANIRVQLREDDRAGVDDITNINMMSASGQLVPLRNISAIKMESGPNEIVRIDREPTVSIGANTSGVPLPTVQNAVAALLASYEFPDGVSAKLGGDAEIQADSFRNLGLAMLLSIVFIYMVLASQFGSFIQPLLIMLAMPLAIIGAILALSLTDRPLDLTAFIGFIMLMGLVTKNSILLVEFANRQRRAGFNADVAMRQAGPIRLRPILMTALSLILAMIPVAVGLSSGGEFRQSMAIAIMGGMITSTFLTLLIVPVAYSIVVGFLDRLSERRALRREANEEAQRQRLRERQAEEQRSEPSSGSVQPAGD
ncbi:MAG: efflux RND transporter permease subunit [Caldilineaceae bacterium]|nr:efflux RND transporter permease subunit [Caldilineaceae bacterium]